MSTYMCVIVLQGFCCPQLSTGFGSVCENWWLQSGWFYLQGAMTFLCT